jgi:hypothetical protein
MRWAGHVVGIGEPYTGFWLGNLRERDHVGDPGMDGKIILKWFFRKICLGGNGLDRACSGWGDLSDVAEKENKEPMAYELLTVKLGLSLSFF